MTQLAGGFEQARRATALAVGLGQVGETLETHQHQSFEGLHIDRLGLRHVTQRGYRRHVGAVRAPGSTAAGSVNQNVAPCPSVLSTPTRPPCRSIRLWTMLSPSPSPPPPEPSPRTQAPKMRC